MLEKLPLQTHKRREFLDITESLSRLVRSSGTTSGLMTVFSPHTTAALTVNENWDPDVIHDFLLHFSSLVPRSHPQFRHGEGNSDGHILASLVGPSLTLIIHDGTLFLGQWQGVYFCEFDGPRERMVAVRILPDP